MCGCQLPVDLVNWTVLHVRWSGCCDSLKDAPKKGKIGCFVYRYTVHCTKNRVIYNALQGHCCEMYCVH